MASHVEFSDLVDQILLLSVGSSSPIDVTTG
jgi:hypothetical protein